MRTREFPVLGPEDEAVIEELAVGLGREEARVLAYLLLRGPNRGAASRLAVRVGTDLGRKRTGEALSALESGGLVATTRIERDTAGRPRKGWQVTDGRAALAASVRARHARRLVERARTVADALGPTAVPGEPGTVSFEAADGEACRLVLNWTPNGFHAPLFFAAQKGFYRHAGVDLSIRSARGSGAALGRVASGAADVGLVGSAVLCRALVADQPVVPGALFYQRAMSVLYTVRSVFGERLDSVEQLGGRTVAMPANSETALLARLFLSQAGVDADVIEIEGEEREALLEGRADVVTGMAADPPALEAEGYTVDSLLVSEQFPVPGPALVVHAEALDSPPAALGGFLTGTMRGVVEANRDRAGAAAAVAARSDDSVEAERRRLEVALDRFADSDAVRTHGWGWQSTEDWQRLLTALRQTGSL